ncbi:putative membrane protein [Bacillus ectoiniformans]|uniref:cytochrome c oxidase assembly factor CtaG n=1 Tax=Bacillus ectoiniformans TaxID=1494429 RepID=UPI0019573E20|nr:cytochrome c oxidase assembly factor CtaG [Bacillus ectoiniformans]MBM7647251.1 putative membrane protein [Bacillus ectoiniformans]
MSISIFGFQALWSPLFMLMIAFVTALYFLITVKWRKDFKVSEPLTRKQAVLFISAMAVLYVIKGSPLDLMGHIMFSYHMVQMAVLYLVVPPLLIKAIPWWVWKPVLELPVIKPVVNFFTKPIIALVFFNGLFSFYHIPLIFDFIKVSETLHGLYTFVLFIFALFMWWPLMNELPNGKQLSGLKKIGYIFADGVLLTPACALIIFASTPLYATYSDSSSWLQAMELCVPVNTLQGLNLSGPELFSNMPVVEDQQLGGVIMKIIQEIVYGIILAQVFFAWFRKEEENGDAITESALLQHQAKLKSETSR